MKKKLSIWVGIAIVVGALVSITILIDKWVPKIGAGYKMVEDIQKIPILEERIDTVEVEVKIQQRAIQKVDKKMDLLLTKWSIPIPTDSF